MVRDVEFDVCDIAPSTYMIAREHGAPFKALPIFVSRNFHHSGFVYRPDAGIGKPKDLEGKNAGVRAYSVTTGVWGRGILQNEYGIDITKITWWVDDEEHVTTLKLPPFVKHVPEGKSLVSMMASGELQAGFTGNAGLGRTGAPKEGWAAGVRESPRNTNYVEFFKDSRKIESRVVPTDRDLSLPRDHRRQGLGAEGAPVGREVAVQGVHRGEGTLRQERFHPPTRPRARTSSLPRWRRSSAIRCPTASRRTAPRSRP